MAEELTIDRTSIFSKLSKPEKNVSSLSADRRTLLETKRVIPTKAP